MSLGVSPSSVRPPQFNRVLKSVRDEAEAPKAIRYTSEFLRRGCPNGVEEAGIEPTSFPERRAMIYRSPNPFFRFRTDYRRRTRSGYRF